MKKRFFMREERGWEGRLHLSGRKPFIYFFQKSKCTCIFSVILKKNFSGFLPVFVHLGDELVYCAIIFLQGEDTLRTLCAFLCGRYPPRN